MGKNKILSGVTWSFAEKLLTDLVSTIITIVLSRILMPEDYGLVALVTIFITISSIFVTTGLGTALVRDKNATEEQMATIFYLNVILGIVIYVILFLCAPLIAGYRGNRELVALVRVLGLKIPISSVYNIQHAHVKKKMEFRLFFWSSFAGTVMSGVVGITMAYMGFGAWALVWSTLTDNIMDSIVLFFATKWFPKPVLKIKECKPMIDFGFKVLVKEFINRVYGQLRGLIIGLKYSSADLAYNTKGQKFPSMFIEIVNTTVIRVMLPALSEIQDDREKMRYVIKTSTQLTMFVIVPIMMGLLVTADNFITILLTDKWIEAAPYIQIYCLVFMIQPLCVVDERALEAYGLGNIMIKKQVFDTIVSIAVIVLALICFDGAIYIALSLVISTFIGVMVNIYLAGRETKYGILEHIKDNGSIFIIAIIMGIAVSMVGKIDLNVFVSFGLQIVAGVIVYAGLALVLKLEPAMYIIDFLKKK
ncbi:MAG: lipopolysaccharide biosynthesis protein [Erysipelotrichaceae bacterium]